MTSAGRCANNRADTHLGGAGGRCLTRWESNGVLGRVPARQRLLLATLMARRTVSWIQATLRNDC